MSCCFALSLLLQGVALRLFLHGLALFQWQQNGWVVKMAAYGSIATKWR